MTSYPPEWPHAAPWKLERELLLPETERILFVVDVPRGAPPVGEALDHLVSLAAKYGQREASWVALGDPGGPNVRWVVPEDPCNVPGYEDEDVDERDLTQQDKDTLRYFREVPACSDGPLSEQVTFVFVRYLGRWGRSYGGASVVTTEPSCGPRTVSVIHMAQTRIALDRAPVMTQRYLETRALAHEYGHVLGLATNPAHGWWMCRVPYAHGEHCTNHECSVAVPTAKALLQGQMLDYCAQCQRDIEQAREFWLEGRTFPEAPRLPQPDPALHVARLKARNFRPGGLADKLLGYGKAVVPVLIQRLPQLPGKRKDTPRDYAARLVLKIVADEDKRRQGPCAGVIRHFVPKDDLIEGLRAWWTQEAQRFISGDQWSVPDFMFREQPGRTQ